MTAPDKAVPIPAVERQDTVDDSDRPLAPVPAKAADADVSRAVQPLRVADESRGRQWDRVQGVLARHYKDPDFEAARALCAATAAHVLEESSPVWVLAIAPPGSMKTDLLESLRGLPGVHFVDEVTTNTFLSGKVDEKGKKRTKPASWLHRIGSDGVLVAADFSTFTSNPKTLQTILAQLRRIYDGHFSREFGTDENVEERSWKGRLTFFAGAVPDIDNHYSLFQRLGERFLRLRWPRAGGVEAGLQAIAHTPEVAEELKAAVHSLLRPILSEPQTAPLLRDEMLRRIASLSEFIALGRTYVERDNYTRVAIGVPITEGNTRLPQSLAQLARGSALLDGRGEADERDYQLVCRAAFGSLPPSRIAILQAILSGESPFSHGLPKATVDRAVEDLQLAGVLTEEKTLSEKACELLGGAGIEVPGISPRYRNEIATLPSPHFREPEAPFYSPAKPEEEAQ